MLQPQPLTELALQPLNHLRLDQGALARKLLRLVGSGQFGLLMLDHYTFERMAQKGSPGHE